MKSCTTLYAFSLSLLPLLFGQLSASTRLLNEVADEATSQVSTRLVQPSVTPQAATEGATPEQMADLRPFVQQDYAAYARKDVEAVMAAWSSESPDVAQRREALKKFFAANDNITVSSIEVKQAKFEDKKAL